MSHQGLPEPPTHRAAAQVPVHPRPAHRAPGPHPAQGPHRQIPEEARRERSVGGEGGGRSGIYIHRPYSSSPALASPQAPFQAQLSLSKEISFPKLPIPEGFFHFMWGGLELLMCMCECEDTSHPHPTHCGVPSPSLSRPKPGTRRRPHCSKEACHPDRPYWLSLVIPGLGWGLGHWVKKQQ